MIDGSRYLRDSIKSLPPSGIRRFFDLASHMEGGYFAGSGGTGFCDSLAYKEACFYSLEKGYTMYTANGYDRTAEEIAKYLYRWQT